MRGSMSLIQNIRKARLKIQPCFSLFSIVIQELVKVRVTVLLRCKSKREGSLCELFDKL